MLHHTSNNCSRVQKVSWVNPHKQHIPQKEVRLGMPHVKTYWVNPHKLHMPQKEVRLGMPHVKTYWVNHHKLHMPQKEVRLGMPHVKTYWVNHHKLHMSQKEVTLGMPHVKRSLGKPSQATRVTKRGKVGHVPCVNFCSSKYSLVEFEHY